MTITQTEFDFVRDLVRKRAAIVLESGKEYLAETRLLPLARRDGLRACRPWSPSWPPSTIHGSTKSRRGDDDQRDLLLPRRPPVRSAAPDGPARAIAQAARSNAGSPSGAPPAPAARSRTAWPCSPRALPALLGWDVRIVASDLSPTMLERGRAGRYTELEVNRGLPATHLLSSTSAATVSTGRSRTRCGTWSSTAE